MILCVTDGLLNPALLKGEVVAKFFMAHAVMNVPQKRVDKKIQGDPEGD